MLTTRRLLLVAAAILFIGLVSRFPAHVAYGWLAPDGVRLSGLSGTLWSGQAREGAVGGIYIRDLSWTLRPLALLAGKLSVRLSVSPAGGTLNADAAAGIGGSVVLSAVSGALSLTAIQEFVQTPGVTGNIRLQFEQIRIEDGVPVRAEGVLDLVGVQVRNLASAPIGDFRAEFRTVEDAIVASVDDVRGMLDIAGTLRITPDRRYSLIGLVAPTPTAPASVAEQLRFLGSPNDRGQREFRFEGRF